jgi:peptidoglycan pentaglycine glycine transferase (the first glycine)
MTAELITDKTEWDALVVRCGGHPLQLWGWGEVKAKHGWNVMRIKIGEGGAQVLIKRLPKPFKPLAYVPRGPFGAVFESDTARTELAAFLNQNVKPIAVSAEPDSEGQLRWRGWQRSSNRILLARTAVMDLMQSDEELLAVMTKKTRQYIRKSAGEGIEVLRAQNVTDVDECLAIYRQTAERAGFSLHEDRYYHDIFTQLADYSPVYMARYNGTTVAFLWPIVTPAVAFELYGGMNDEGQALRANYHLKWSVIQEMKRRGVRRYDVNGLLNDGVTTFKKGFIPDETQMSGTYDRPLSALYPLYSSVLPAAKRLVQTVRRFGS